MEDLGVNMAASAPHQAFWQGKRVLLTGHTGFKGAWLGLWLQRLGAKVTGLALPPPTQPSLFEQARISELVKSHYADIRDAQAVADIVRAVQPQIVLHLAAQALVRESYRDPLATFATNVQGTANVLDAVFRAGGARVVVAVTTDKVYQNLEHAFPYRETDALGGQDPYSASKAACELVVASYRAAFLTGAGVAVASARAGNVIGGGDWAADRLVPDAIRAWRDGLALAIRRPLATRPWQHVLEPLSGYLVLAERLWAAPDLAGAYNFGPPTHEAATVRNVVELAQGDFGHGNVVWGDGTEGPHEAGWLALEVAKSRHALHVHPRWPLEASVRRTVAWYRHQLGGADARVLCLQDIADYEASLPEART